MIFNGFYLLRIGILLPMSKLVFLRNLQLEIALHLSAQIGEAINNIKAFHGYRYEIYIFTDEGLV